MDSIFSPLFFSSIFIPLLLVLIHNVFKGLLRNPPSSSTNFWVVFIVFLITVIVYKEDLIYSKPNLNPNLLQIVILELILSIVAYFISILMDSWIHNCYNLVINSYPFDRSRNASSLGKRVFSRMLNYNKYDFSLKDFSSLYYNMFRHKSFPFIEFVIIWSSVIFFFYYNLNLILAKGF
jgi:hypothetical protein